MEKQRRSPEDILNAIEDQEVDEEIERIAKLSDAEVDRELLQAGVDPQAVGAKAPEVVERAVLHGAEAPASGKATPERRAPGSGVVGMARPSPLRPKPIAWTGAAAIAASAAVFAGTHRAQLVAWWETGGSDHRTASAPPSPGETGRTRETAPGGALELPEAIGDFRAGAPTKGPDFVRRTYARGADRVTATLARLDLGQGGYARWLHQSLEGYPQADLDLAQTQGNGFYECSDDAMARCNLLIQMQSGVHIEIRAEGGASRADVDAIAKGLRLGER